jgi:hypothetical protein
LRSELRKFLFAPRKNILPYWLWSKIILKRYNYDSLVVKNLSKVCIDHVSFLKCQSRSNWCILSSTTALNYKKWIPTTEEINILTNATKSWETKVSLTTWPSPWSGIRMELSLIRWEKTVFGLDTIFGLDSKRVGWTGKWQDKCKRNPLQNPCFGYYYCHDGPSTYTQHYAVQRTVLMRFLFTSRYRLKPVTFMFFKINNNCVLQVNKLKREEVQLVFI